MKRTIIVLFILALALVAGAADNPWIISVRQEVPTGAALVFKTSPSNPGVYHLDVPVGTFIQWPAKSDVRTPANTRTIGNTVEVFAVTYTTRGVTFDEVGTWALTPEGVDWPKLYVHCGEEGR